MGDKLTLWNESSLKYIPFGLIDKKSALVYVMAWFLKGDKPIHEPVLIKIPDAILLGHIELTLPAKETEYSMKMLVLWFHS